MSTTTAATTSSSPSALLTLPLELRLQIYSHLLVLPSPHLPTGSYSAKSSASRRAAIQANILRTCRQIHTEGSPLLYRENTWLAHPTMLTSFPRLRPWFGPLTQPSALRYFLRHQDIDTLHPTRTATTTDADVNSATNPKRLGGRGRWHIRIRLDCDAPWTPGQVSSAFSGADELLVECWQTAYKGAGPNVLKQFEDVRGCRRTKVYGSIYAFGHYAEWLAKIMELPFGTEVDPYVRPNNLKERDIPSRLPGEETEGGDGENESENDVDMVDDSSSDDA